ncbi:MAG: hypothetical protein ACRDQD_16535 [Nocardioidaceae bacterium]
MTDWRQEWDAVVRRPSLPGKPAAVGGDLTAGCVLAAYESGFFPFPAGDAGRR